MKVLRRYLLPIIALAVFGVLFGCSGEAGGVAGASAVNLRSAGGFAILAKSAISNTPTSAITGDVGLSPAAASDVTGLSLTMDASGEWSTSSQVTGKVYASDYTPPTPEVMTAAISDMELAYTDAAGRTLPDETELGAGEIGGLTLASGLYKWGTGVSISTNVTLSGGADEYWIFQIGDDLTVASAAQVLLSGGASASNIVWQVAAGVTLGSTSHVEGTILGMTAISLATGATVNGKLFAQTAVSLDGNTVTTP